MKKRMEMLWDRMRQNFRKALMEEKELIQKFYAEYDIPEREDLEIAQLVH